MVTTEISYVRQSSPRESERAFLRHPRATGRAIARSLGTDEIDYPIPSIIGLGDRHYNRVQDLEHEVTNARIWGGIHYRTSVKLGS
jgi:hypothetical protein